MLFKLIRTWEFPKEDLKIIRDDWSKIHSMILDGKADELTEGLTFYLAACMKGSKAGEDMRRQPFSERLAQQRAYSLKSGYINKIILSSYLDTNLRQQLHISSKRLEVLQKKYSSENIVKSIKAYKRGETFEELIERRMKPYYGKTVAQIVKKLGVELNPSSKDFSYHVCRAILGVRSKRIQEFENAGVSLKTIALEANRDYIVQSMSFPYIRFVEIVNHSWEGSDWYNLLTSKFFFVVFRKSSDDVKHHMKLEKVFFWNMPRADLAIAEELWCDTKKKFVRGDYDNFITTKSHPVCHVRPHGTKGQTVESPQGTRVQPKCFWLNNDYILDVVKKMM
jgi:DNA mismatch repair protein MutH